MSSLESFISLGRKKDNRNSLTAWDLEPSETSETGKPVLN